MTSEQEERDIQFQKVVTEGLVPKVEGSAACVAVCPTSANRLDAKFCVELGVMIMLDKPILAIVTPGETVPEKLRLVADRIVVADISTSAGRELIGQEIQAFQDGLADE